MSDKMKTDLVDDLTHQRLPKNFNLSDTSMTYALKRLKEYGMPASYIKNRTIKEQYKQLPINLKREPGLTPLKASDSGGLHSKASGSTYRTPDVFEGVLEKQKRREANILSYLKSRKDRRGLHFQ